MQAARRRHHVHAPPNKLQFACACARQQVIEFRRSLVFGVAWARAHARFRLHASTRICALQPRGLMASVRGPDHSGARALITIIARCRCLRARRSRQRENRHLHSQQPPPPLSQLLCALIQIHRLYSATTNASGGHRSPQETMIMAQECTRSHAAIIGHYAHARPTNERVRAASCASTMRAAKSIPVTLTLVAGFGCPSRKSQARARAPRRAVDLIFVCTRAPRRCLYTLAHASYRSINDAPPAARSHAVGILFAGSTRILQAGRSRRQLQCCGATRCSAVFFIFNL